MRKPLLAILTICLLFGLTLSAYAAEIDPDVTGQEQQEETQGQEPTQEGQNPEDEQEPQDSPVTVSTLDELQAAIEAAEDGDTIVLLNCVYIDSIEENICNITIGSIEKSIILIPADDFENQSLFYLYHINGSISFENIILDGGFAKITAIGTTYLPSELQTSILLSNTIIRNFNDRAGNFFFGNVQMDRCLFEQNSTQGNGGQLFFNKNAIVKITDCTIKSGNCTGYGAGIYNNGSLEMYNCEISDNIASNNVGNTPNAGALYNQGSCYLEDCCIVDNTAEAFGGISNSGTLMLQDSLLYGNIGKGEVNDLFGSAIINYSEDFDWHGRIPSGWYDDSFNNRFNGENNITEFYGLTLDGGTSLRLVFVFEDEITKKPDSQPGADQQPTTPEPPTSTDEGDPDNPPETTEQPTEPPQDDAKDEPTVTPTTTPDTPEQPQEPADSNDGDGQEITPAPTHTPTWGGGKPSVTPPAKEPDTKPEPEKPILKCGNAVLDTSKEIVLLGYGDGLQHEEDSLTRAQLATIIYRLLDKDSIAKLTSKTAVFVDVSPDMWCYEYVQTISAAGIVYGTGGGCYSPNSHVTWAQILTVLSRFVEPQEYTLQYISYEGWAQENIQTAVALGWIVDNADFSPDAVISRGELVRLVNRVLELNR